MHACGHDVHVIRLRFLGAAKILNELKEEWAGNVKFIFQPAKQQSRRSKILIKVLVLENPIPDAIFAMYVQHGFASRKVKFQERINYG